jgi:hypothetical protein
LISAVDPSSKNRKIIVATLKDWFNHLNNRIDQVIDSIIENSNEISCLVCGNIRYSKSDVGEYKKHLMNHRVQTVRYYFDNILEKLVR